MKKRIVRASTMAACLAVLAVLFEVPVSTHHSFAMYDQTKTVTLTGVVKQFVPQANHAEIHFILLAPDHKGLAKGDDGKYVEWGIEMAGAAAVAQQGITGDHVRRRHGVQRQPESASRRVEFRFPGRRDRQVPHGPGHQQTEAPRAGQALRFRSGQHVDWRHDLLTVGRFRGQRASPARVRRKEGHMARRDSSSLIAAAMIAVSRSRGDCCAQSGKAAAPALAPSAKTYVPPRTPWGDPDLQGIWPSTTWSACRSSGRQNWPGGTK